MFWDVTGGGEDVHVGLEAGAEVDVPAELFGSELGRACLDLAANDPAIADAQQVGFGPVAVVRAEPHVYPWEKVQLPTLALECLDGQQVRQYVLVAEQVDVAVEPVVHRQCGSGVLPGRAGAAGANRPARSPAKGDEAGQAACTVGDLEAAVGPSGGAQSFERAGGICFRHIFELLSALIAPLRPSAPVGGDLGEFVVHDPVLAEFP